MQIEQSNLFKDDAPDPARSPVGERHRQKRSVACHCIICSTVFERPDGHIVFPHAAFTIDMHSGTRFDVLASLRTHRMKRPDPFRRDRNAPDVLHQLSVFSPDIVFPNQNIGLERTGGIHHGYKIPKVHVVGTGNHSFFEKVLVLF